MPRDSEQFCWVGLDWGDEKHAVCVLTENLAEKENFEVPHTPAGLDEMITRLRAGREVRGVAVEISQHLVVYRLLQAGFTVYSINPKLVKAWRESEKAQPSKTDAIDAEVMAYGLLRHHSRLRPLTPADDLTRQLVLLCEDEKGLIEHRTRLVQQLQATLKQYYPQALPWFSDWTKPTAWDFVLVYPRPEKLRRASNKQLIGFLKKHRIGISARWAQRLEGHSQPDGWQVDEAVSQAKKLLAVSLAKQLRTVEAALKQYRQRIEALFQGHPDRELFLSLPGAAETLAPRLASHFGTDRDRFASAKPLQELSGVAPVSEKTGKRKKAQVKMRRRCQPLFRDTMHLFAWSSTSRCPWARAFYEQARAKGQSHGQALRNLANKWLKIIYRMWRERKPYDEARYLNDLIKHGSPLIQHMKQSA